MTFVLSLVEPESPAIDRSDDRLEADDEMLGGLTDVLCEVCARLQERGFRFRVQIGSPEDWPVDVATDLAIVVEQLPDLFDALAEGREGRLEFFEQGVERIVLLRPGRGRMVVQCRPLVEDSSVLVTPVLVAPDLVIHALRSVAARFLEAAETHCDALARNPWFVTHATRLRESAARLPGAGTGG